MLISSVNKNRNEWVYGVKPDRFFVTVFCVDFIRSVEGTYRMLIGRNSDLLPLGSSGKETDWCLRSPLARGQLPCSAGEAAPGGLKHICELRSLWKY